MEYNNFEQMTVLLLKILARERGLRGFSRLNKAELIKQLRNPPPLEYTRAQLIQLARERGLRGYSRLNKTELLQKLIAPRDQILDRDIDARMANVPFLTPTPYTLPQATAAPTPSLNAVEDLIDYLNKATKRPENVSYMFSPQQKLKNEIDRIFKKKLKFEVKEGNSALKNFA